MGKRDRRDPAEKWRKLLKQEKKGKTGVKQSEKMRNERQRAAIIKNS